MGYFTFSNISIGQYLMVEGCSVFTMEGFVYITRLYNRSVISRAREAEFSLVHIQFLDDLRSDIKLRTRNITKILFCKNMNDSCGQKLKLSNHYETANSRLRPS